LWCGTNVEHKRTNGSLWQFGNVLIEAGASIRSFAVINVVNAKCSETQWFVCKLTRLSICFDVIHKGHPHRVDD